MPTGPQRVILIRSGRYDYAEVELKGALQIVGPNNTGKTTLINTLQFLYLDDRRHMYFGSYDAEQTREFYFPSQYSYILFECLGATGQCVIGWRGQSKASGTDPERFFHSGPFVAADFLNLKNQVREPRDVNTRLAAKQFRIIKNAQDQRELLLPAVGGDGRGLGIVALRDADKYRHFRETLKNLLMLSAITQEEMRDRLLMHADIAPDWIAFDARALFSDDYDRILARREKVIKFKKNKPLIEQLVDKFAEREAIRGELVWRWTDLRVKRQQFETEHKRKLAELQEEKSGQQKKLDLVEAELPDRRNDMNKLSEQKGQVGLQITNIEDQDKEFGSFLVALEQAALSNLTQDLRALETQLANAEGESHERAKRKVDAFTDLVKQKDQVVRRFDRLVVSALRKHFKDDTINTLFCILSRDLLEMPLGAGGVAVSRQRDLLATLNGLLARTTDGAYRDASVSFPLPKGTEPLSGLENVETAREQLAEYRSTLKRWNDILAAIEQREVLQQRCRVKETEVQMKTKELFRFDEYQKAKANEPRLRSELEKIETSIAGAKERIAKLTLQSKVAESAIVVAERSIREQESEFDRVIGNLNRCTFPDFSNKARVAEGISDNFDHAITLYLRQQEKQNKMCDEITNLLIRTEALFGDEFRGADDFETVSVLQDELETLDTEEEALARDWNAHIHVLRGTFDLVLKNLDHVRSAADSINRAFSKVQISHLKNLKLEVVEQSDLLGWIKRLAAFEPGGLFDSDPQQQSDISNFRRRLQDNPVIRFASLFTLAFTVTGTDDQRHTYHDFRQIESHGTTIAIKVLFNLLLLKNQLRREDCAVPFFLDEIQTLDPVNRQAIVHTARQLGFIAITAAPEPVSEVDTLYFLQPQKGRIVLRQRHRIEIKLRHAAV
jgi:hypothetical protein